MLQLVQFVFPSAPAADELCDVVARNACARFEPPERSEQLVPQDVGDGLDDDDDPEIVKALSALYWFRRQEPLEDEE